METLYLSRLEPHLAAQLLAGCARLDPRGTLAEADVPALADRGACFAATAGDGQAVYVLEVRNGVAWVSACKGTGPVPWTEVLLPVIEAQTKGVMAVAFQTSRAGLVRRAKRQGYRVTGWILKKEMK